MSGSNPVTLVAPFSVLELAGHLSQSFHALGSTYSVRPSPITSVIRYMVDQERGLPRYPGGIHILLFRFEDWNNVVGLRGPYEGVHPESRRLIEANLAEMIRGMQNNAEVCFGALILVPCPPSPKYRRSKSALAFFAEIEDTLREAVVSYPQYLLSPATHFTAGWSEQTEAEFAPDFWKRLARQLVRVCYAAESRPWRGVVLGRQGAAESEILRAFVANQWRAGRPLALASEIGNAVLAAPGFAAIDQRHVDLAEKVRYLASQLMTPFHDLIFAGAEEECRQVSATHAPVLTLPIDIPAGLDRLANQLWCFDPLTERWLTEQDATFPSMPRLTSQALINLANYPASDVAACCVNGRVTTASNP